jgi:hypothetical protein
MSRAGSHLHERMRNIHRGQSALGFRLEYETGVLAFISWPWQKRYFNTTTRNHISQNVRVIFRTEKSLWGFLAKKSAPYFLPYPDRQQQLLHFRNINNSYGNSCIAVRLRVSHMYEYFLSILNLFCELLYDDISSQTIRRRIIGCCMNGELQRSACGQLLSDPIFA